MAFGKFYSGVVTSKGNNIKNLRETSDKTDEEKLKFIHKFNSINFQDIPSMPTLSVMIANFNMEKFLQEAIHSYIIQSVPFNQILVVDDENTYSYL